MIVPENIKEFISKKADEIASTFYQWAYSEMENYEELSRSIESPVEQLFFIEWYSRYFTASGRDGFSFILEPQYHNEKLTGKYILDFKADFLGYAVNFQDKYSNKDGAPEPLLAVEIDGHIWHEKTKNQVQYHKERERFLVSKGWKVLRFTGSEVFKDPAKCVDEFISIADPLAYQWHKQFIEFLPVREVIRHVKAKIEKEKKNA